jgi:hypothetical protein
MKNYWVLFFLFYAFFVRMNEIAFWMKKSISQLDKKLV